MGTHTRLVLNINLREGFSYPSDSVHNLLVDGILEFHFAIEWELLVVGDQLNDALKVGVTDGEETPLLVDAAMFDLTLRSATEGRYVCLQVYLSYKEPKQKWCNLTCCLSQISNYLMQNSSNTWFHPSARVKMLIYLPRYI